MEQMTKQQAKEITSNNFLLLDDERDSISHLCIERMYTINEFSFCDRDLLLQLYGVSSKGKKYAFSYIVQEGNKYYFRNNFFDAIKLITAIRILNNYDFDGYDVLIPF